MGDSSSSSDPFPPLPASSSVGALGAEASVTGRPQLGSTLGASVEPPLMTVSSDPPLKAVSGGGACRARVSSLQPQGKLTYHPNVLQDGVVSPPVELLRRLDENGELVSHSITVSYPWKPSAAVEKKWVAIGRRLLARSPRVIQDKDQVSLLNPEIANRDIELTDRLMMNSEEGRPEFHRVASGGSEDSLVDGLHTATDLVDCLDQADLNSPGNAPLNLPIEATSPLTPLVGVVPPLPALLIFSGTSIGQLGGEHRAPADSNPNHEPTADVILEEGEIE
ncbi:hypothetical protein K2173_020350 [Erythroxylum novogranatense]|uniref:Uncharacterized protein n=1 Tax=Erythroxylum novogranatense TaxID=1862640 RepID=A0AAV8U7P6_9ROSI|nr:hypothetical protein K2173_020350 [Erythroxylum novogranatense]